MPTERDLARAAELLPCAMRGTGAPSCDPTHPGACCYACRAMLAVAAALERARAEEREACAEVADTHGKGIYAEGARQLIGGDIAAAIRERGGEP